MVGTRIRQWCRSPGCKERDCGRANAGICGPPNTSGSCLREPSAVGTLLAVALRAVPKATVVYFRMAYLPAMHTVSSALRRMRVCDWCTSKIRDK